ncbi:uncharacterized protein [Chironomus tepperi]|uniref:uncharacterized protein n=1 Tax=Chironomus tepperi TaxID=113505 RepID=UPI00391EE72D
MNKKLNSEIEQFIDIVKEYPIIYSKPGALSGSVNNNEKNQVWAEIAKRLNEDDPGKLKQKWRNLRDSYQKAMKYKRDLEEVGQLSKYHPYRHEHKMSFLLPHILADIPSKRRKTKVYEETEDSKSEKNDKKESVIYAIESQEVEYLVEDSVYAERNDEEERIEAIVYKENNEDDIEQTDEIETESNICYEEVESCHDFSIQEPTEMPAKSTLDDIDVWLTSIKASLLKLTKINRARAKRDINSILSNYEIEQYEAESN